MLLVWSQLHEPGRKRGRLVRCVTDRTGLDTERERRLRTARESEATSGWADRPDGDEGGGQVDFWRATSEEES